MITDHQRRMLQGLMEDPRWQAVEAYCQSYLVEHFITSSIKRETDFETLWWVAYAEGGKEHIRSFFNGLEQEARKV